MKGSSVSIAHFAPALFAILIDSFGFALVVPILTDIFSVGPHSILPATTTFAMRNFYLGLGFLLFPLCMFFGASFMGDLSDMLGRKKTLLICLAGLSLAYMVMGIGVSVTSISLLFIGRAMTGLFAGNMPIAQAAIGDMSNKATIARNMSLVSLAITIGFVLGPFIAGFLSILSFSLPFYFGAACSLLALLWMWVAFTETFIIDKSKPHRISLLRPITLFFEMAQHKKVFRIAFIFFCMQIGFSVFFMITQVILKDSFHYPGYLLGLYTAYIGVIFLVATMYVIPKLISRYSIERITFVSLLITGVFELISAYLPYSFLTWLVTIPIAGADIIAYTMVLSLFSNSVDSRSKGWVMGIAGSLVALTWAISGASTNLIELITANGVIIVGGCFMLFSLFFVPKAQVFDQKDI